MPTLTLEFKDINAMKAMKEFVKFFPASILDNSYTNFDNLPITKAKKPNIKALAGIWKNKTITLQDLRNEAWKGRQ